MDTEDIVVYDLNELYCDICGKIVRLVPIRFMKNLYKPNFSLGDLVTKILFDNEIFICSMCATTISFSAIVCYDFRGKFICFVCRERDRRPYAYLKNYNNPLFKEQNPHLIYYRKYLHKHCLQVAQKARLMYNLLKSDKRSKIERIKGYKRITSSVCAPMILPLSIPRPIDHILPEYKPIKIYIDLKKIEDCFAKLKIFH